MGVRPELERLGHVGQDRPEEIRVDAEAVAALVEVGHPPDPYLLTQEDLRWMVLVERFSSQFRRENRHRANQCLCLCA